MHRLSTACLNLESQNFIFLGNSLYRLCCDRASCNPRGYNNFISMN